MLSSTHWVADPGAVGIGEEKMALALKGARKTSNDISEGQALERKEERLERWVGESPAGRRNSWKIRAENRWGDP